MEKGEAAMRSAVVRGAGRRLTSILALLTLVLWFSGGTQPAFAFDLVSADPAVNSTITTAPSAVTLTFSSEVTDTGSSLTVRAPSGIAVDDGSLLIDGTSALVGIKKLEEGGRYTVTYQFMSIDGEVLSGSYSFSYDAPAEIASPSATPTPTLTEDEVSPGEARGKNSRTTDIFVIALLVISFLVLIFIARLLRNPKKKRRKKK